MKIKVDSFKGVLVHLGIIITIGISLILFFFYIYLPSNTNHGETITVPNVTGMHIDDLEDFLVKRNLRYAVNDSAYTSEAAPLTIVNQFPSPGKQVKEDRVIYISLNRVNPPTTRMPNLVEGSLKNAEAVLRSYELERGKILWEPDPAFNAVLEQRYQGKPIEAGLLIPKGSVIDLVIGDGRGKVTWRLDDLRGNNINDAKIYLLGAGLEMGEVTYDVDSMDRSGVVIKHIPAPGRTVRLGQQVDIWIGSPDSLKSILEVDKELAEQIEE